MRRGSDGCAAGWAVGADVGADGRRAAVRFVRTRRAIESAGPRAEGARIDLALGVLMVALGIALVFYVTETVLGSV